MIEALQNRFIDEDKPKERITDAVIAAAINLGADNITDYLQELSYEKEGSFLEEYDEDNLRVRFLLTVQASVAYTVLRELIAEMGGEVELYYIGNSNGSTQGLLTATKYFAFRRMVLVNMPLMLNFHKIKAALTRTDTEIRFVYGEGDPSISYVPFLRNASSKEENLARAEIVTVGGADHNFAGMTDVFIRQCVSVIRDGSVKNSKLSKEKCLKEVRLP